MQGSREKVRVSSTREGRHGSEGRGEKGKFDKFSIPSRKPQSVETVTGKKKCVRQLKVTLSISLSLSQGNITRVQSKPVNTDVNGGRIESVCINGLSV